MKEYVKHPADNPFVTEGHRQIKLDVFAKKKQPCSSERTSMIKVNELRW